MTKKAAAVTAAFAMTAGLLGTVGAEVADAADGSVNCPAIKTITQDIRDRRANVKLIYPKRFECVTKADTTLYYRPTSPTAEAIGTLKQGRNFVVCYTNRPSAPAEPNSNVTYKVWFKTLGDVPLTTNPSPKWTSERHWGWVSAASFGLAVDATPHTVPLCGSAGERPLPDAEAAPAGGGTGAPVAPVAPVVPAAGTDAPPAQCVAGPAINDPLFSTIKTSFNCNFPAESDVFENTTSPSPFAKLKTPVSYVVCKKADAGKTWLRTKADEPKVWGWVDAAASTQKGAGVTDCPVIADPAAPPAGSPPAGGTPTLATAVASVDTCGPTGQTASPPYKNPLPTFNCTFSGPSNVMKGIDSRDPAFAVLPAGRNWVACYQDIGAKRFVHTETAETELLAGDVARQAWTDNEHWGWAEVTLSAQALQLVPACLG